jgi:hypothetical protein
MNNETIYATQVAMLMLEQIQAREKRGEPMEPTVDDWSAALDQVAERHHLSQPEMLRVFALLPEAVKFIGGMTKLLAA